MEPKKPIPPLEPCYSMRLLRPFVTHLEATALGQATVINNILTLRDDHRIPVRRVLSWLDAAVAFTGDQDLGLRAAQSLGRGAGDVLELVAGTATTFGEAMEAVLRYIRILNEAADFGMYVRGGLACIELRSCIRLNRAAADFQIGALVRAAAAWLGDLRGFEVWFSYPQPADTGLHAELFAPAQLRFAASYDAVVFNAARLSSPLKNSDPALHKVLRAVADQCVAELPESAQLSPRVRKLLVELLPSGDTHATRIAAELRMSRRTLTRHLANEGVTLKALLEKARHQMALHYVEKTDLDPGRIAFLLGYSATAAFSRAFTRWEGKSPTERRRERAGTGPSDDPMADEENA